MEHTDQLKLDLCQTARARSEARRKNFAGGLGYLRARIRSELEERWAAEQDGDSDRVLLVDFDDDPLQLGKAATIRQVSPIESSASGGLGFFRSEAEGLDGVIVGPQMAWLESAQVLTEALRLLRPGGRLLFCTLGPDTLVQLRWAWGEVDEFPHVHPFIDMHHLGDQLLQCGFARPIVDVDRVTVEYADASMLYADLRGEGFTNALRERRKTLTGKARFDGFAKALESLRESQAPLAVTYELIYGTATAPSSSPSPIRVAPPAMPGG